LLHKVSHFFVYYLIIVCKTKKSFYTVVSTFNYRREFFNTWILLLGLTIISSSSYFYALLLNVFVLWMYSAKFEETDFEQSLLSISDASNKYYTEYIFDNLASCCKKSDRICWHSDCWLAINQIIIKQYLLPKFATCGTSTKRDIDGYLC